MRRRYFALLGLVLAVAPLPGSGQEILTRVGQEDLERLVRAADGTDINGGWADEPIVT